MECPKCGFVSSPQPPVCKRCGHRFAPDESEPDAEAKPIPSVLDAPLVCGPDPSSSGPTSEMPMKGPAQQWQDEIAERVARYRRRRSRIRDAEDDAGDILEFDFSGRRNNAATSRPASAGELDEDGFDAVLEHSTASRPQTPALDSVPFEGADPEWQRDVEWAAEPIAVEASGAAPVEIVLGSGPPEEEEVERTPASTVRLAAPLGRRLAAALVDALVLLIAACVFTLVFAKTGGLVEPRPSNVTIVVLGVAAASLVVFYFVLFTALAFATPGQSALGLRVRTLDDHPPGTSEAVWRGLGYLVSAAALMLGFVWALFDSQGLTWHDHMSGTCLTLRAETTASS